MQAFKALCRMYDTQKDRNSKGLLESLRESENGMQFRNELCFSVSLLVAHVYDYECLNHLTATGGSLYGAYRRYYDASESYMWLARHPNYWSSDTRLEESSVFNAPIYRIYANG